ncbi:hypothetical protein D9M72_355430 [compost metagenome]
MKGLRDDRLGRVLEVGHHHHAHPGGQRGLGAVLAVLEGNAVRRVHAQALGREAVQRRVGLGARHLVAAREGLEVVEHVEAAQAGRDLAARGRRGDRAARAASAQGGEQLGRAGLDGKERPGVAVGAFQLQRGGHLRRRVLVGGGAAEQRREDLLRLAHGQPHALQVLGVRKLDIERAGRGDPGGHDGALRIDQQPIHVKNGGGEHRGES